MAASHLPATILRPTTRHHPTTASAPFFTLPPKNPRNIKFPALRISVCKFPKCVVGLRSVAHEERPPETSTTTDVSHLVDFLYEDLPHLFDNQGIDRAAYDESVKFIDPITKHDDISGYLFNIAMLKQLFSPDFQLHWVKQTGQYEITTRWTMVMKFVLLPWKPELIFTGTSVMGINPKNMKFCSHVDYWDSIENNAYFSMEGLLDVIKQLRFYKTPDLQTPKYQILKRTANYEVRKYDPFIVVETNGDKLAGSSGFNAVAGYIFGKNSTAEKIAMTTPVFTEESDSEISKVLIQIVIPPEKDINSLPAPNEAKIRLRKVEGGIAAVSKFSGKPTEDVVRHMVKALSRNLKRDDLKAKAGCLLARYNDPGRTWSFTMVRKYMFVTFIYRFFLKHSLDNNPAFVLVPIFGSKMSRNVSMRHGLQFFPKTLSKIKERILRRS